MINRMCFIHISFIAFIFGCASTQPPPEYGKYSFRYEGKDYIIYSTIPGPQAGHNTLLLKHEGQTILLAVDKEQDGFLDEVRIGDIPLDEAQKIYKQGINLSKINGVLSNPETERYFRYSDVKYEYEIESYLLPAGESYNTFTIREQVKNPSVIVFQDLGANGKLDILFSGKGVPSEYQRIYIEALKTGIMLQRVIKLNGKYQVTENPDRVNSFVR